MNARDHADGSALVEYWLGELSPGDEAALDEHLLGCDACGARLDEFIALAGSVRDLFDSGRVHAFLSEDFVRRLGGLGVRVREYKVERNGSVNCTVMPEDQLLVARLEAPLDGVTRLDAIVEGPAGVFRDIPFDAARGVVMLVPRMASLREMPTHVAQVRLVAVDSHGERVLGEYTFSHSRHA